MEKCIFFRYENDTKAFFMCKLESQARVISSSHGRMREMKRFIISSKFSAKWHKDRWISPKKDWINKSGDENWSMCRRYWLNNSARDLLARIFIRIPLKTSIKINNDEVFKRFSMFRARGSDYRELSFDAKFNDEHLTLCVSERFMSWLASRAASVKNSKPSVEKHKCWTHAELCNDDQSILSWLRLRSRSFESLHCL